MGTLQQLIFGVAGCLLVWNLLLGGKTPPDDDKRSYLMAMLEKWKDVVREIFLSLVLVLLVKVIKFLIDDIRGSFFDYMDLRRIQRLIIDGFHRQILSCFMSPKKSKVKFGWDEPQSVGESVSFQVEFFQWNGRPCEINKLGTVEVHINQGSLRVIPNIESKKNFIQVSFMVRRSGEYQISVLVRGRQIQGSPFVKYFHPLAPNLGKTRLVRQTSMVIGIAGLSVTVGVEARDEFGNICNPSTSEHFSTADFSAVVTRCGGEETVESTVNFKSCKSTHKLLLSVSISQLGCFHVVVYYQNIALYNGEFDIVVLNLTESETVRRNAAKSHNINYEARLVKINKDKVEKPSKVYISVSARQLIIKEYFLKLIPKRLYTYRLCPTTKLSFLSDDPNLQLPVLAIEDNCQSRIELASRERDIVAATFAHFLLKNIGGSETFSEKQDFFNLEIRKAHKSKSHDSITLKINREKILECSMKATKGFSVGDWCKNFLIVFSNEEGQDCGGLRREWFELLASELFSNKNGMFKTFSSKPTALMHPNSCLPNSIRLKHFEFAGRIVGKCLYESALGGSYTQLLKARFTRSFLAQVIGLRVHYSHFEQDDPDFYLRKVKYILENEVSDLDLTFAEEEYGENGKLIKSYDLIPGGANVAVTNANKLQYLDALAQYRLSRSIKDQVDSFLKGLSELIPDTLLTIFDENELELLICGTSDYDLADFKANHVVLAGSSEFSRVVEWFWIAVSNFSKEEMARLLQFTTGCSQLPQKGFSQLSPKFQLSEHPAYGHLPSARTCFNMLCLPDYDSYEHFERSLLLAINEGSEGFGLI